MAFSSDKSALTSTTCWWMRGCWIVGTLLFFSTLLEIPWRSALRGYDNTFNYLWLRSAMVDGDWDFRNDLSECDTLTEEYRAAALNLPLTKTGLTPNKYGVGWAVVTLPSYLIADGVVTAGRWAGWWDFKNDGFNPVYQIVIQAGHFLMAWFALWFAVGVLRSWLGEDVPVEAGIFTVWAASPLVYYQTSNLSMSHGATFFSVSLGAWAFVQGAKFPVRKIFWLLAGLGFGLAAITRFQSAIFGLLVICTLWGLWRRNGNVPWSAAVWIVLGAAPSILVQSWAWHIVYGEWLIFSYGAAGEGFNWSDPQFVASLGSSWHGLYYWHPLLAVATIGLLFWAWRQRGVAIVAVGIFFLTVYVNASWWCWWLASAFGNRAYDAALLPLMAGQAYLFHRASRNMRTILWGVCGIFACWNLYVLILYRSGAISRQDPVSWWEMILSVRNLPAALGF